MKSLISCCLALFILFRTEAQIPGSLDHSFNSTGIYVHDFGFQDNLTDIYIQPDHKILSCGTALNQAFAGRLLVLRQNADGTPDAGFGTNGAVMIESFTESYAYALQVKNDGKILVAGAAADPSYAFSSVVLRLNANGSIDSTFGVNGWAIHRLLAGDNFAYSMLELSNHQLLIAGTAIDTAARNVPVVIRLNENGSVDSTFGTDGIASITITELDNRFNKIALQSDGKIVAAGHYGNPITNDGQFDFDILVARFNADGSPDLSFSGDGMLTDTVSPTYVDDIFGLALTNDHRIVVSGFTTQPDFSFDAITLQYDSNGVRNTAFANNGVARFDSAAQDVANGVVIDNQGRIIVAGTTGVFMFDNRDLLLLRYTTDGSVDSSFGGAGYIATDVLGFMDEANAITLQPDGKIVLAGKANNGNQNDVCLARYYNDEATGLTEPQARSFSLYPNPAAVRSTLTLESDEAIKSLRLFDASGRLISYSVYGNSSTKVCYQLPGGIDAGVYLLRLNEQTMRLVVY
ncbi:MAG: T9SS type A sorting domain-containing protein [Chitinophagales bacterium]